MAAKDDPFGDRPPVGDEWWTALAAEEAADTAAGRPGRSNSGDIAALNNSGVIRGGAGGATSGSGGAGGAGVENSGTIGALTNSGAIFGGRGGDAPSAGPGGAGIENSGAIAFLVNSGAIGGGAGGSGSSAGGAGGAGISNIGTIAALSNSGTIAGAGGGSGLFAGGEGGAGLANAGSIGAIHNSGAISGGGGGQGDTSGAVGSGGAGLANAGTIGALTNTGRIGGGAGGSTLSGGWGGTGVGNSGTIAALTNSGTISGGAGGAGGNDGGGGGAGVMNAAGAEISAIVNARGATIRGAKGGSGFSGGDGGSGVANAGEITALINSGAIRGGGGGNGEIGSTFGGPGGAGGAGVSSAGALTTLTNAGTIRGGQGGSGITGGAGGAGVDFGQSGATFVNSGKTLGGNAVDGGAGGDGVIGAGLAIVDSGTIDAGYGGRLVLALADAVDFVGGVNSLTLEAGATISGAVVAYGLADTLALGGAQDSSFEASAIGSQYQGFGHFEKTGASLWTLYGTTSALTPWAIDGGTLAISENGSLGAASGGVSFDGGALEFLTGFTTARAFDLEAGGGAIDVASGEQATLSGAIAGDGRFTKTGSGELTFSHENTYAGGTVIAGGALDLAAFDAAGSGAIAFKPFTFSTETLTIENDALASHAFDNAIKHFGAGDVIDLAGLTYAQGAHASYDGKTDTLFVTSGGVMDALTLVHPVASSFVVASDGASGTDVTLVPIPGLARSA